jgi:hypothetical protein
VFDSVDYIEGSPLCSLESKPVVGQPKRLKKLTAWWFLVVAQLIKLGNSLVQFMFQFGIIYLVNITGVIGFAHLIVFIIN